MADNYLENKYEALSHGKTVIKRVNPSLDTLLKSIGSQADSPEADYADVKQAQTDAILRSAGLINIDFEAETIEPSKIIIKAHDRESLGEIILAIRLKAAELKLLTSIKIESDGDNEVSLSTSLAEISIYKLDSSRIGL